MDWDSAIQTGFTKLNGYIQGKNEKGEDSLPYNYIYCGRVPWLILVF